jgi:S1-C subfamily serine protease
VKVYACVVIIFIGFIGNYVASAQRSPGKDPAGVSIAQVKPLVVQITFKSDLTEPGYQEGIAGSGFMVSDEGYVLTAAHVVTEREAGLRGSGATKVEFFVGILIDTISGPGVNSRGSFAYIPCTIKDTDPVHDIAILQLAENPFSDAFRMRIKTGDKEPKVMLGVAKLEQSVPGEGQTVLVSGYPGYIPTLVTQRGMIASEGFSAEPTPRPGAGAGSLSSDLEDAILLDAVVNPGISGGPVYLPGEHSVIGICRAYGPSVYGPATTPTPQRLQTLGPGESKYVGLAIVIPIKYAIALLQKNKIETKLP